jgi:hypothetical protein
LLAAGAAAGASPPPALLAPLRGVAEAATALALATPPPPLLPLLALPLLPLPLPLAPLAAAGATDDPVALATAASTALPLTGAVPSRLVFSRRYCATAQRSAHQRRQKTQNRWMTQAHRKKSSAAHHKDCEGRRERQEPDDD